MAFPDSWVAIIVNLNLKVDTAECIQSMLISGISLDRIIVVDNGSTDDSLNYLQEQFGKSLVLVDAVENSGYAHGLNIGIKKGIELKADWFFLMNNDTIVDVNFFRELSKAVDNNANVALFGPLILYYAEPKKIWYLGDSLIPATMITYNPYRGKTDHGQLPATVPVDFIHGCGMLVHRSVFERIGFFDDWSLIYAEEVDFIWRARQAGFKALGVPNAKMWHKISSIMKKQKPKTRFLRIRNQIRFYRRYATGVGVAVMFIFSVFRCLYLTLSDIFSLQANLIPPLFQGWFQGWFGKLGRDLQ
jgi:hypothetical protein